MKSKFLVVLALVFAVMSAGWIGYKEWEEFSSPRRWPLSIFELFERKRDIRETVYVYGYLIRRQDTFEVHQNKDLSNTSSGANIFPYLTLVYPEDKMNKECINSYVAIHGKLFGGFYGPAIDEIRYMSNSLEGIFCVEPEEIPRNFLKERFSGMKANNE